MEQPKRGEQELAAAFNLLVTREYIASVAFRWRARAGGFPLSGKHVFRPYTKFRAPAA
jgi:hypothetical protein